LDSLVVSSLNYLFL